MCILSSSFLIGLSTKAYDDRTDEVYCCYLLGYKNSCATIQFSSHIMYNQYVFLGEFTQKVDLGFFSGRVLAIFVLSVGLWQGIHGFVIEDPSVLADVTECN